MAVALGSVSHDIYDAAAKMLENKRIQTQLQIAREQIKQQQRSQAMGMAGQALSALNHNRQNRQAQAHQAQQRELDRRQAEENNRTRGLNMMRQGLNKRIDEWKKRVAELKAQGFEFDPADMQQMIAMEKKFTDEMKTLSPEQRLQAEQDFHDQFTRFMPTVQRFPHPKSWKFTDPDTKQTYPYNPVTKVVDWLHPLGVTVDDAERIRKNDEDHKLKMMDQKRKNLEEARAIFKDEYESGSTYNEAADAALATTGIDPKGGIRKSPGDPGFTHTNFKEVAAQLNQQKYYDSVMDRVMERAGKNYDEHEDRPSPAGRLKAMTEAWEKSPYFKSYQDWKSKQEAPSAQQASAATQAQPENQLPQEVHEAMQYLQNIKTFMERAAAAGKGDKPFDSAATANTVQAEIRRATDVIEAYQRSKGIFPKRTAPEAVAPQQPAQPTAVQQSQPAAVQQPQAPQVAPADTGERKGPFKGRIINDNRTSSLGGGGTGLLAMGINPLQAIYDGVKSAQPEKQAAPFGATDASQQEAGSDPAFGFRTKMESWLERNPAPATHGNGPYFNVKGGGTPTSGSAFPSSSGATAGSQTLNPSAFSQAVSQLDEWEKLNPDADVSAVRQATAEMRAAYKLPAIPEDAAAVSQYYGPQTPWEFTPDGRTVDDAVKAIDKATSNLTTSGATGPTKTQLEFQKATASAMAKNGVSASTAMKAAEQIAAANKSLPAKALSGLGTVSRNLGGLGNILTMLGWVGSHLQTPSRVMDERYRDWAVARMAVENSQADAFGLPRDEARKISNQIDGYRDGSRSDINPKGASLANTLGLGSVPTYPSEGFSKEHLKEMQAKADRVVPEKKTAEPSGTPGGWSNDGRYAGMNSGAQRGSHQRPEITLSPFAFVNENELRSRAIDELLRLADKVRQDEQPPNQSLEQKTENAIRSWDDFDKYPWPKFKEELSSLAKDWESSRGAGPLLKREFRRLAGDMNSLGDWNRQQPNWSRPDGATPDEWSAIQKTYDRHNDSTDSFFGAHIDKPGSYLGQNEQSRKSPEASRQQSNTNQIKLSRDSDGNLNLTNGAGQTLSASGDSRELAMQRPLDQSRIAGQRAFSQENLASQFPNDAQNKEPENLVTAYLASPNSEIPKGQDKDSALSSSAEANQSITEAANNGLMPFDLKWNYDKTPGWAEKLPAFEWRNKDGKIERQSGFKGADKLIDDVSKSMEVGKYDPATVAAENAAKEQQNAEPPATPNPLPKELTAEHINALRPENQEAYLREPVAPTRKEFDAQMREQYGDPIGGGSYDADYQAMIDARNAVRSSMPQSVDDAAPGNLFIDKDGTLKRNDNGKPSPVKPNDPLPPGYGQRVTLPQPQQLPQVANPQAMNPEAMQRQREDAQGDAMRRAGDFLQRANGGIRPAQQQPNANPQQRAPAAQPMSQRRIIAPDAMDMVRQDPISIEPPRIRNQSNSDLSSDLFSGLTNFDAASRNLNPSNPTGGYIPDNGINPRFDYTSGYSNFDPNQYYSYYSGSITNRSTPQPSSPLSYAYDPPQSFNYQPPSYSSGYQYDGPSPSDYSGFEQQFPAYDSPDWGTQLYDSYYPSGGYYPAGDYNTSAYYDDFA